MDRAPHFLRVAQALAFVPRFGPVVVVVGAVLLDCGSSDGPSGPTACAESDPNCNSRPACEMNEAGGCIDAAVGGGGVSISPDATADVAVGAEASIDASPTGDAGTDAGTVPDGSTDASVDGGPLLPPDLPA